MNTDNILTLLSTYDKQEVKTYIAYLNFLANEKNRDKSYKNPWVNHRNDEYLASCFESVKKDDLIFDGKHITLQKLGVSYDYVAYKNKMLNVYPESLFDVQLVREGDNFRFSKNSGIVTYQHEIPNPFSDSKIIGGYCVIKNNRGEFLTTISRSEIDKHRLVAKTDYVWRNWFDEMALKTIIKKACKVHFSDIYHDMEEIDNEQYDLDQPLTISVTTKQEIEAITDRKSLSKYYADNKSVNGGFLEDFTKACVIRKDEIIKSETEQQDHANDNS